MMPNLLQYPIAVFGILRAGMIVVNVNPLYTPRELEHQLKDPVPRPSSSSPTLPIPWKSGLRYPGQARDPDPHGDNLGLAKGTLVNFVVKYVKKLVPKYNLPHASTMRQALAKGRYLQYIKPEINNDDLAFLQYTGGTTGLPRGHADSPQSHRQRRAVPRGIRPHAGAG